VTRGHITASFFVNREEPLANLLEVMRHLMSHNGHLKTADPALGSGAGPPASAAGLSPASLSGSPERYAAALLARRSRAYTRWLATHHYENFHVVSFLLPKRLHQDFYNVYAYCRWADDLGDEIGDRRPKACACSPGGAANWKPCMQGRATHPVFVALRGTVARHADPAPAVCRPDRGLRTGSDGHALPHLGRVFGYCRYSANPVGRLVLYLCGYSDAERQRLSDATCTALQLANFWQDVTVDLEKDRVYIPLEVWRGTATRWRISSRTASRRLSARSCARSWRARANCSSKAAAHRHGGPAPGARSRSVQPRRPARARQDRGQDYDVLARRPAISKAERVWLLLGSLARVAFSRAA
jgi:phytoene/squalene synthetase